MASSSAAAKVAGPRVPYTAVAAFWRIGGGFFAGRGGWRIKLLVAALALLGVAQVGVQLSLNVWSGMVFDAIEQRDTAAVLRQVGLFIGLASAFLLLSGYTLFAKMRLQVDWRAWITNRLVTDWLAHGRNAELAASGDAPDNPEQRIAEDVRLAAEGAVDFADGIFHALLLLACFVTLLWTLSGRLEFEVAGVGVSIPGYLVWAAIGYAGAGTFLTYMLGRPLIRLNQEKLSNEADFRISLFHVHANSAGEGATEPSDEERRDLGERFARVIVTWRLLMLQTRRLSYMTSGYAIIATGFPVLITSPDYFAHSITLGGLMQATAAFITVQDTLSWFVNNYARFADWSASVRRIATFRAALDALIEKNAPAAAPATPAPAETA
jgi:vitamin B12/bleomycin/antimicrobial peptide transport system ATP-binding/permease protein